VLGVFQPFSDALKLFYKEFFIGDSFSSVFYFLGPFLGLFLMGVIWFVFPIFFVVGYFFLGVVFFFCVLSVGVYFLLFCGWGSNNKYGFLGSYRGVSQMVSYEVSIIIFGLCYCYFVGLYDFYNFWFFQVGFWFFFFLLHIGFSWLFVCLAESNRSPFDFSEGESELVSGFNVEFGGVFFSLIFICEYGFLLFLGVVRVLFFFGGDFVFLIGVFFFFFFVWIRGVLPRFRYDLLMFVG
jgi:NADH-ubiquinone oxidoreductase chain 1